MKKIAIRTVTGTLYVALLVAAMVCGPMFFAIVFGVLLAVGILECAKLCGASRYMTLTNVVDMLGGLLLFFSTFLWLYKPEINVNPVIGYLPYLVFRLIAQLYSKKSDNQASFKASAWSQIYVALPLTLLNLIYFRYGSPALLLAGLIFIWVNDTGAFCVGSLIGKHRLFERVSPKKSWEGFFGGLVFTIVAGIVISIYFSHYFGELGLTKWIIYSILVSIFATWGDLIESLIKRAAGVKDSGNILPGHGGVLDRIDSLLLVTIASTIYFYIIQ